MERTMHIEINKRVRRTGLFIAILLAVLLLVACTGNPTQVPQGQGPQGQAPTSGEPTRQMESTIPVHSTEAPPAPAPSDAKASVIAAFRKGLEAGKYRIHSVTTSQGAQIAEMQGDVLLPDRMHFFTTLAGSPSEIIVVGDKMWIKSGEAWSEMPFSAGLLSTMLTFADKVDLENTIQEAEYLGDEDLNGVPMYVYRLRQVIDYGGQKLESLIKMWVGKSDGRIYRQEITNSTAGLESTTVQDYEWDVDIVIEPPVPYP
jgi:hypothetical protein